MSLLTSTEGFEGPCSGGARLVAATKLAASRFGLDLGKYPMAQTEALLKLLPETVAPDDEETVARLLSVCSVGETMFMRHPEQLNALKELVATGSVGELGRPLAVWSAGCATGEEVYSLAAVLAGRPGGVSVLGTDVSERSIEKARTGRYAAWSLRGMDPASAAGWLELGALSATVRTPLRREVAFRVHNLTLDEYPRDLDVIFCRNVLLYFREDAAEKVIARFYESLRPGGVLFLGYVDPHRTVATEFVAMNHGSVRFYRKPKGEPSRVEVEKAAREVERAPRPARKSVPKIPLEPRRSEARSRYEEQLTVARTLCAQGARDEALALLADIAVEHPLEVDTHVIAAMAADEAGERAVALASARRAYFLAPEEPVTAFLLGVCLDRAGERSQAERRLFEAKQALGSVEDPLAPLLHGEGMTAYQLRRAIDARIHGK